VVTMAEHVDEPRSVEFQLPKSEADLQPGQPLWANYVKGVIAFFPYKGNYKSTCLVELSCFTLMVSEYFVFSYLQLHQMHITTM